MKKEELKNFHYTHKNEIQFEYGGQVHHYNMDNLKKVIITAWELQERINKAIKYIEETTIGSILEVHCGEEEEYTEPLLEILKGDEENDK